jgi:anti-sigma B factor antagonist
MTITERSVGDVTVLDLTGRLVLYEGEADFRKKVDDLVAHGRTRIVVNLNEVDYMDSAGVGVLVGKFLSVRRTGGDIRLLHLSRRAQHVMDITRLLSVFQSFDNEQAAITSFTSTVRS